MIQNKYRPDHQPRRPHLSTPFTWVLVTGLFLVVLVSSSYLRLRPSIEASLQAQGASPLVDSASEPFELTLQLPSWALCTQSRCIYSNLTYDPASIDLSVPHRSQTQEDEVLFNKFFYGMKNGFFLEMGALNGLLFSNTFWFAKAANWKGLLIEPSPDTFSELLDNRKESICLNAAICAKLQRVHYLIGERYAVRGIYEFMAPAFLQEWFPNVTSAKGLPEVPCLPLSAILSWLRIHHIDMWSLDVEGAELLVLEAFDFERVTINVIVVEVDCNNNARDAAIESLLVKNGFSKLFHQHCKNAYFVSKRFLPFISSADAAIGRNV